MIYLKKHARVLNLLNQKCSFESVQFFTGKLKFYVTFTSEKIIQMEEEFLLLQSITLQDFDDSQLSEATIKTDEDGDAITYRTDILLYHLFMKKIARTSKSKFENLFKFSKEVFSIVHSNAEEQSLFSRVSKILTLERASLQLDEILPSIIVLPVEQATWSTML